LGGAKNQGGLETTIKGSRGGDTGKDLGKCEYKKKGCGHKEKGGGQRDRKGRQGGDTPQRQGAEKVVV